MLKNFITRFFLCVFFCSLTPAFGMTLLNIADRERDIDFLYSAQTGNCRFLSAPPELSQRLQGNVRKPGIMDEIYLAPSDIMQSEFELSFRLSSIQNIRFFFHWVTEEFEDECRLIRSVVINGRLYEVISIDVRMTYLYLLSSIYSLTFEVQDSKGDRNTIRLLSHELSGFFSLYEFSLGLVLNIGSNIRPNDRNTFKRTDPSVEPLPAFLIRYGPFFINNDGAGFVLVPFRQFLVLTTFLLEGEPYKGEGLRDRERSLYMGPLVKSGILEFLFYKDIASKNNGEVYKFTLAPEWQFTPEHVISFKPFVQYWDRRYNEYYFGIIPEEGAEYNPGSAVNYGVTIQSKRQRGRWSTINSLGYKHFGRAVQRSPITKRKAEFRLITGAVYSF
jgi:hypothetical protein